jgi:hypothetical protein
MSGTDKQQQKQVANTQQDMTRSGLASTQQPIDTMAGMLGGLLPGAGQLTDAQTGALNTLSSNAAAGNLYAPQIGQLAGDLFSGGKDYSGRVNSAFDQFNNYINPTARGDYLSPDTNPFFNATTNSLADAATKRIAAMYEGSGRDASGAGSFAQNAGKGVAEATAPIYAGVYNNERDRQMAAISAQNAGANTATGILSGLDQTSLANRLQGIGVAGAAMEANDQGAQGILAAEAQRLGIPLSQMGAIGSMLIPLSQTGGTGSQTGFNNTTTNTDSTMSGAKQAWGWMSALKNFIPGAGIGGK